MKLKRYYQDSTDSILTGSTLLMVGIFFTSIYVLAPVSNAADQIANGFETVVESVDSLIEEVVNSEDLIGANVALVYKGDQIWSKGYGLASKRDNIQFTNKTNNSLYELTKMFTAVGIMQLVEQNVVELDVPFNLYVPEFSPYISGEVNSNFTVRQLMSHHSGLPERYAPGFAFERDDSGNFDLDSESSYRDVLQVGHRVAVVSPPGQVFVYSELGYTLLGLLIEKVTGQNYSDYVRANILEPLGMMNTYFGFADYDKSGISSFFYGSRNTEIPQPAYRDLPAVGMISNAADMALFMQALVTGGGGIVDPNSLDEMLRPQNSGVKQDNNFEMGLGFFVTPPFGGIHTNEKSVSHESPNSFAGSYFVAFPEHQVAIFFSTNTSVSSSVPIDTVNQIIEEVLGSITEFELAEFEPHKEIDISEDQAELLVGAYSSVGGLVYITRRGNNLRLSSPSLPFIRVSLIPREEGFFGGKIKLLGIIGLGLIPRLRELTRNIEGKLVEVEEKSHIFVYSNGDPLNTYTKIEPSIKNTTFDTWMSRIAIYESELDGERFELVFDEKSDNFLFGLKKGPLQLFGELPELYRIGNENEIRRNGYGIEGRGAKNVLRIMDDGRLLDAFGVTYSLAN